MLRFAVFDDHGPARDWPLAQARLLDRDDLVVPGVVTFEHGLLQVDRRGLRPTALRLLHQVDPGGDLCLQTCLLPHREAPYVLSVELARHRIASFLAQAETWQMHLSAEHPSMQKVEAARQIFTRAMVTRDPREAYAHGTEALGIAIEASELLTLAHAEVLLHRRYDKRAASRLTFGTSIWPERDGAALRDFVQQRFGLIKVPMAWRLLCPREGVYDWSHVDRWMEWALEADRRVVAGPLLDFAVGGMPEWMGAYRHDFGAICDLAYNHVLAVVQRYGDAVGMYSLVAGVNTNLDYQFTIKQMEDLVRTLALVVRQGQRKRRVMVELSHLWGDYLAHAPESVPPIAFIEQLLQSGIRLDVIGLRLIFGETRVGIAARDLMEVSRHVDRFLHLEPKLWVSALGVPDREVESEAGWWHSPWTPDRQGRWVGQFLPLLLSKPFVEGIIWSDLYDHDLSSPPGGGLLGSDGKPKPVLRRLAAVQNRLSEPLGNATRVSP